MKSIFSSVSLIGFFSVFVLYVQRIYFSQSILVIPSAKNWSQLQQGYLHGAFYLGYLLVQILAGILCKVIGGRQLAAFSMLFAAITFTMIPAAAENCPFGILIMLRAIMGASQGVLYPAIMAVLGIEIPRNAKSTVVNFVFSGGQAGSIFVLLVSPFLFRLLTLLISSNNITFIATWQLQFIVFGVLGILITIAWLLYMLTASALSPKVLADINDQQCHSEPEMSWSFIFSQKPFWAYVGACAAYNWFMMIVISFFPKLLRFLLHFGTDQQQILSAIPYSGFWILTVFTGILTDYLVSKKYPLQAIRKGMGIFGYLLCSILLLILGVFFDASTYFYGNILNFVLISAVVSISGICKSSFGPNGLDICRSPVNIGKITGAAFFAVSLVGIISPMIASALFQAGGCTDTLAEPLSCYMAWRIIFLISSMVNLSSAILWGTWLSTSPIQIAV